MDFSFSAYCRRCRLRRRFRQSLGCALAPRPPVFFSPGRGGGERSIPAPARRNTVLNYHCFWEVKINSIEKYKEIRNPTFFFFWRGGAVVRPKSINGRLPMFFFGAYNFIHIEPWRFRFPVLFAPRVVREKPWKIWIARAIKWVMGPL